MKILIIDKVHNTLPKRLKQHNHKVDDFQDISPDEAKKIIKNYEGLIIRSKIKLDKSILNQAKNLKFIARVGAGMESIDVETAKKLNIKLINAPEGNRDSVGEHCVGMILALFNKICSANISVKQGNWDRETYRGIELMGKTVGLIGYGNMGSAFARRLSGFGVKVISYDKYKIAYSDGYTEEVDLQNIFEQTDILSLHIPLTKETHYLVDGQFINNFKKHIYIINTSRGKVIKTSDLVSKIKEGKILGAALDVIEYENISFNNLSNDNIEDFEYLQKSNKVLFTPHVAGITHQSAEKLADVTFRKIQHFVETGF